MPLGQLSCVLLRTSSAMAFPPQCRLGQDGMAQVRGRHSFAVCYSGWSRLVPSSMRLSHCFSSPVLAQPGTSDPKQHMVAVSSPTVFHPQCWPGPARAAHSEALPVTTFPYLCGRILSSRTARQKPAQSWPRHPFSSLMPQDLAQLLLPLSGCRRGLSQGRGKASWGRLGAGLVAWEPEPK